MKPFIVTDENILNSYGYRVMTGGIDMTQFKRNPIMLYMHQRNSYNAKGNEVIGKWQDIEVKKGKILMTPNFDEAEDFASKIKGKVDREFIKMSSIGIRIIEISTDPKYMLNGQTRPTVTKCKLVEVSIVDVGANDNAMQLYAGDGATVELNDALPLLTEKTEDTKPSDIMNELKIVAQNLGLKGDADLSAILTAIGDLKQDVLTYKSELEALQLKNETAQKTEANKLISALKDGKLIDDAQVPTYEALFKAGHESAKAVVEGMLKTLKKDVKKDKLDDFIDGLGGGDTTSTTDLSFEKLSKENPAKLAEIEAKNPKLFEKLLNEYSG